MAAMEELCLEEESEESSDEESEADDLADIQAVVASRVEIKVIVVVMSSYCVNLLKNSRLSRSIKATPLIVEIFWLI